MIVISQEPRGHSVPRTTSKQGKVVKYSSAFTRPIRLLPKTSGDTVSSTEYSTLSPDGPQYCLQFPTNNPLLSSRLQLSPKVVGFTHPMELKNSHLENSLATFLQCRELSPESQPGVSTSRSAYHITPRHLIHHVASR